MDLRQLRYYARIVELESITAAAQALHVAQPSLSQHIANLEAELDTVLLQRSPLGVRPTDTGLVLYQHAKAVLRQVEEASAAVARTRETPSGHVTVGLPTSTSRVLALPLIDRVAQTLPGVTLELIEASTYSLAESVATQRLDMAIAMEVRPRHGMRTVPLFDEELMLVGLPIEARQQAISLAEAASLPLLLPSFPNSVRVIVERACSEAGLPLTLVAETSAVSILLTCTRHGRGWTVLPWSALAEGNSVASDIVGIPILDDTLRRRAALCVSAAAETSLACQAVEHALVSLVRELIEGGRWRGARMRPAP
ncbi:LysR family transcriptional regulator [Bordetella ansorpii]|uniref:LysR family transcriptional regulator n=1 Tax=Bordetella ansorpii TaxID=288768 RepID=A0A157PL97_9BORD|nr:LysR substrate-binding domain-containing protein [Bordetella ansorpii]SAI34405.1 LysR family transcriptional regulator [Bordetella ansorpii]